MTSKTSFDYFCQLKSKLALGTLEQYQYCLKKSYRNACHKILVKENPQTDAYGLDDLSWIERFPKEILAELVIRFENLHTRRARLSQLSEISSVLGFRKARTFFTEEHKRYWDTTKEAPKQARTERQKAKQLDYHDYKSAVEKSQKDADKMSTLDPDALYTGKKKLYGAGSHFPLYLLQIPAQEGSGRLPPSHLRKPRDGCHKNKKLRR